MSQFIEMFSNKTWKEAYLEDVVSEDCSLSYGIVQPGEGVKDGIPVVRPVDLVYNLVEPDYLKKTTIDIAKSYKRTTLKGGELLLCVRGTTGILSMASDRLNGGNVTRGIVPIWFKKDIYKAFMFHQIKSDYVQTQIKEKTYGTTLLQINIKDLRKIKIILPPEDLQLKFVSIAEQADKSGFVCLKSQFIEMFGDPIKNSKNLPSLKGEELFVFSSGKANTKANLSKEFPYDCYGGNGITGKSEQWLIDFPTIIVGRVGEYCGCVHKTQGKIWITDNAIFIKEYKEKVFNGEFLFYLMTYLDFHRLADETGQPKITQRPLLSTEYMVPNLSLQEQFVSIAHQADKSGYGCCFKLAS